MKLFFTFSFFRANLVISLDTSSNAFSRLIYKDVNLNEVGSSGVKYRCYFWLYVFGLVCFRWCILWAICSWSWIFNKLCHSERRDMSPWLLTYYIQFSAMPLCAILWAKCVFFCVSFMCSCAAMYLGFTYVTWHYIGVFSWMDWLSDWAIDCSVGWLIDYQVSCAVFCCV